MTEAPTCDRCGRRIVDTAYVCPDCARELRRDLETVAKVAGEVATTVAKLARLGAGGRRSDPQPPLPVNLDAGAEHDAAVTVLTTWARHIHEASGRALPTTTRRDEHPLAILATWLVGQLDWLRHRPEGGDALDELSDACRILIRVVDRPADRVLAGRCPCGEYLYAIRTAATVTCRACNTGYDVQATRRILREQLGNALFTGAEIATLATYLGLTPNREATRNLIKVWASRGMIVAHGTYRAEPEEDKAPTDGVEAEGGDGDDEQAEERSVPLYRFGDVIERLAVSRRRVDHAGGSAVTVV